MRAGYVLSGRYKIKQTLGEGGMANVYLAQDLILQRPVAVKLMRLDLRDDPAAVRRFQREAISLTELTHPNIVSIYDVGEDNGMQYLIMEYVEGTDLKAYIQQNFPLSFPTVVAIMEQILAAVEHAHSHGIIHRDLKPQNILIDQAGQVKITDFGIALATTDSLTQTNTLMGSVHYLSPEQARGSVVTKQSDIYSLGIILFELLTKRVPFQGETAVSIALKHYKDEMPAVRQFNSEIPQALENVIAHATAKSLADRYQTAAEMAADLKTALSLERANEMPWHPAQYLDDETKVLEPIVVDKSQKNQTTEKKPVKKKPWSKKKKWLVIIAAFVGFLIILSLIAYAVAPRSVKVPDLQGMTKGEAEAVLQQKQLKVGKIKHRASEKYYEGQIVTTDPATGSSVRQNSKVTLVLSSGPEKRPFGNYNGQSFSKVKRQLEKKGVTVLKDTKHSEKVAAGEIISQSIRPQKKIVWQDTTVTFTVSSGTNVIKLRDLTGYTRKSVVDYAAERGLELQSNWQDGSSGTENKADLVVGQNPAAGTIVQSGSILSVTFANATSTTDKDSSVDSSKSNDSSSSVSNETSASSSTANNQFNLAVTIPYNSAVINSTSSSSTAQQVQVYLADDNHSLDQVYQTLSITKDTKISLPFTLNKSKTGKYKIVENGTTIAENSNVTSGN